MAIYSITFPVACVALLLGTADAQPFNHPGVVVNRDQLDFVKAKIQS